MDLSHWKIIILRPKNLTSSLEEFIRSKNGTPVLLPMIEIVPLSSEESQLSTLIKYADYVLITSQNSVLCASDEILSAIKKSQVISMGASTSEVLAKHHIPVFFTAPFGSTSESLLLQPVLQSVAQKKIVILQGVGGRDILTKELKSRGADVEVVYTYQQKIPDVNLENDYQQWTTEKIKHAFIATSVNMIANLISLTPSQFHSWLFKQPLLTMGERIDQFAKKSGFQQTIVATSADPAHIGQALQRMLEIGS